MPTIRTRFYPLNDVNQHDVINLFSLNQSSGLAGTLVKIVTGAANPAVLGGSDGYTNSPVGTNIANVYSYRYETKLKVTPTVSGDTAYNALGLLAYNVLELDENSQPLRYNIPRAKEIGAVISGETVPIITKSTLLGMYGQYIDSSMGNIQPGNVVVVSRSGNGLLAAVDPNNVTNFGTGSTSFIYTPNHVIGKWLTSLPTALSTGLATEFSAQGGYALFQFDCNF